jgi:predicted Fe-Mo cluster-binding NifX family protein
MKIAVTAKGDNLEAQVDPRFGRCQAFVVVESDDMSFTVIDNSGIAAGGGAGIQAAQQVADSGAEVLLTGSCGPNAFKTLDAAGVKVVTGVSGAIATAVKSYMAGELTVSDAPNAASHNGMHN